MRHKNRTISLLLVYYAIDPQFGTMEDFEFLITEASARSRPLC